MDARLRSLIIIPMLLTIVTSVRAQTGAESKDRCVGGGPSAPVRIEVFSCYQCPPCRDFYLETIRPLLKDYGRSSKVCVIYYEFPLKIHDYSREAARYGEAARHLGQEQWQHVSEALYQHLYQWAVDKNFEIVVAPVLSRDEMAGVRKIMEDPSVDQAIDKDIAEGHRRHITGTPTFFIYANGKSKRIVGSVSYPVLKDYIDGLLK
ncbi:putative Twin-arginine translocation pathway signal [uncultured Desulfobacterium sp.]|uniref:Putative Twin-arginine translocation pathway signal n=1 Tax=uncultured Desulfobacterium sp. TaxID=201089 RepID=A0A445N0K6_9BACT|nr:putative Twin-arginine translocation pathway signal [uncultured Desulfobacterium sp.]